MAAALTIEQQGEIMYEWTKVDSPWKSNRPSNHLQLLYDEIILIVTTHNLYQKSIYAEFSAPPNVSKGTLNS